MRLPKLKATSIIEIAIALVIISVCLGIASRLFVQFDQGTKNPVLLKDETTFQSRMVQSYFLDTILPDNTLQTDLTILKTNMKKNIVFTDYTFSLERSGHLVKQYHSFKKNNLTE